MFERYTERARRVIFFSRYEASQLGRLLIEPEHILLGLIREDRDLMNHFCDTPLPPIEAIESKLRQKHAPLHEVSTAVDLPLSDDAKRALVLAAEESKELFSRHIGTEHLLLGLIRENDQRVADVLSMPPLNISAARNKLKGRDSTRTKTDQVAIQNLRELAGDLRNLAAEMVTKLEQIEAACDEVLGKHPPD